MWTFYLAGAAAAFRYWRDGQLPAAVLAQPHALPITRDYMIEGEQALREARPSLPSRQGGAVGSAGDQGHDELRHA